MKLMKISILVLIFLLPNVGLNVSSMAFPAGEIHRGQISLEYRNVTVYAPAVAQTSQGYVGVISTITVTIQSHGNGRVFVDTLPLTQIDMQGSARLAVKVASTLVKNDHRCQVDPTTYDYFFVVRTSSPIIGGPSAGAVMTTAVVALLENWTLDSKTVMTGMINPDGSIGPIGGIIQKCDAAYSVGATRFLIPKGQNVYTETITETTQDGMWTQIRTRQVKRNVSDYAMTKYGIEVCEVEDINEAILYFTGWTFTTSESNQSISTKHYVESMQPLATQLLQDAKQAYRNASAAFNTTEIPNRFPYYYKNEITDYLNNAEQNLKESQQWYDQQCYYTSTSNSFQSLIDSQFVSYACRYFNTSKKDDFVQSLLTEVQSMFDTNSQQAKNAEIRGTISLQCVGAAQTRVSEAASYITKAQSSYSSQNHLTALYQISFARQRIESIHWWLGIGKPFNDTGEMSIDDVRNLAEEYIEDARQAVVYADVIVDEMGQTSSFISEAEQLLSSAEKNRDEGYIAAALFEALEALVKANLALETVDGSSQAKVDRAQEQASSSISESRKLGIEPVLAVSYYEYGQSLENESSYDLALVYYKYANLIAGAIRFTSTYSTQNSRYYGIPEPQEPFTNRLLYQNIEYAVFFLFVGGIGGLGIGLLIVGLILIRRSDQPQNQHPGQLNHADQDFTAYYRKQKSSDFPDRQIPRSIQDYFKKQK
ncbi:MAG: S16 family serine protease [Candidatus Thermoplasmatota archaeon]